MKKFLLPLCLMLMAGCYYDKEDALYPNPSNGGGNNPVPCDTVNMTYTNSIKPIFEQYCNMAGCHDAITKSSGHNLTTYAGTKPGVLSGKLLGSVKQEPGYFPMPKDLPKLSDCDIAKIEAWINAGAPE